MSDIAWTPLVITVYGIAAIVCAVIAWFTASRKYRDRQSWAFTCFFLPPMLLVLVWLKPLRLLYAPALRHNDEGDDDGDGDGQATSAATRYTHGV